MSYRILTINPGSTSTKVGCFNGEELEFVTENKASIALVAIISELEVVNSDEKKIVVEKSKATKCPRCWTYSHDFSDEGICMKCKNNM